jgi:GT2 family glycosyltransferase
MVTLLEQDPQIAACQPKIRLEAEPYLFEHAGAAGGYIDKWGYPFCRGRIFSKLEEDRGQYDDPQEVFWASGAALFIRAACFHNFGGFDEDFKAHMEEIDLCWRLKRGNYKIVVCTQSVVWHVGGGTLPQSSPHKTYLNFRNSLGMVYNNETEQQVHKTIWMRLLLDGVAGVRFLMNGEFKNIWAIVRAHWHFFGQAKARREKRTRIAQVVAQHTYEGQAEFRSAGRYSRSIVWEHFIRGKQTYSALEDPPTAPL